MDRPAFYTALRGAGTSVFGSALDQGQVDGIEGILAAMEEVGDGRIETVSYALATAYHETGRRMCPVREGFAASDQGAIQAVAKLAQRLGAGSAPAQYGKPAGPYGKVYYGRGLVQLTWLENYQACSKDAGVDLVAQPDAMLDPRISARILIRGLIDGRWNGARKGIAFYLPSNGAQDLKNARRTVNGTDRWDQIAAYYKDFHQAVTAAGGWGAVPSSSPVAAVEAAVSVAETVLATAPAAAMAPAAPDAGELSAWLAGCPCDPRKLGQWLTSLPPEALAAISAGRTPGA